jgi:hypothetical protein
MLRGLTSTPTNSQAMTGNSVTFVQRLKDRARSWAWGHTRTQTDENGRKGAARPIGIVLLAVFALSWIALAYMGVKNHHEIASLKAQLAKYDASTVEEHHVAILARLNNGDFAYYSDEEPKGSAWRPCPADQHNGVDTVGILLQGIGFIADVARWEERGTCKSILRADLGFDWKDSNNNFKYVRVSK